MIMRMESGVGALLSASGCRKKIKTYHAAYKINRINSVCKNFFLTIHCKPFSLNIMERRYKKKPR